jgi:hypothetical protein
MTRCLALCLRMGMASLSVAALHACISNPPPPHATVDSSYDWHGLIVVPFGTLLKDSPLALHEVLLFHDAAHAAQSNEDGDCFGIDAPPPLFGRRPDDYLLCFKHDRLNRIDAAVSLPAAEADAVLAAACAHLSNGIPPAAGAAAGCDGREGATVFRAHLDGEAARSAEGPANLTLSISLFSVDPTP